MSHKTNKITHLRFLKWRFPHVCGRRARVCCCLEVLLQENVFFFYIQIMDFHMIMDHLDQSNKPVNRVNAVKSTFLQKHRYDILNLYVCLGWIFFFSLPSQRFAYALLRFPSQVRKTSLIIPVFVATIMNGGGLDFLWEKHLVLTWQKHPQLSSFALATLLVL